MKYTKIYRDDDNIGIWVITAILFIVVGAVSCWEKTFSLPLIVMFFPLIVMFLYAIYFVIQNEIQDNHNKMIDFLNDMDKENKKNEQ